jgi:small subunit ribosomal protein S20
MANIKSSRKSARQAVVRRAHNFTLRTEVRTAIKNVKKAIAGGDKAAAAAALEKSRGVIDRVAAKGILHRNAAARHKSRLAQAIKAMP